MEKTETMLGSPSRKPSLYLFSWAAVGTVTALLVIAVILNVLRLSKTQISLVLETTDLSFTTLEGAGIQNLIENLNLTSIGFGDVSRVQMGNQAPVTSQSSSSFPLKLSKMPKTNAQLILEQVNMPPASTLYLNVVPIGNDSSVGSTPLERLIQLIPKPLARVNGALVRCGPPIDSFEMPAPMSGLDCDYQLEIEVNGARNIEVASVAGLEGRLRIVDGGLFVTAAPFRNSASMLAFDFTTSQSTLKLASQIKIAALSFVSVEQFNDANDTNYDVGTGIESGTLYLEDLNGKEFQLRPGEDLSFEVVDGDLRTVDLGAETMSIQFSGSVKNLMTGERRLMPTWFEYGFAIDWVKALLAALVAIATLIVSLGNWLLPRN